MSESRSPVACTLHEVEIHRLWQAIVSGQSAPWMASRWMSVGSGAIHPIGRPVARPTFKVRGLESLKKAIAEGIAFWIARQDAGCGPRPWKTTVLGNVGLLRIGPEALELLSGLVHGKWPETFRNPQPDRRPMESPGNALLAWIIGDWAISHAPIIMETLIRNVSADSTLLWAACHPRILGLLPPESPTDPMGAEANGDSPLEEKSLQSNARSGVFGEGLIPLIEGALAMRLERAWKLHHRALKEATSLPRIQERARWARQTWAVWEALLGEGRAPFWLPRLLGWVGEVLEPLDGLAGAFAEEIDWKGTPLAQRQELRRDALLALRIGARLTQKYEDSLRVGYLDETYDDAQGYLRRFRDAGGAPWRGLVPSLVRELFPTEAPAAVSTNGPNSGDQR